MSDETKVTVKDNGPVRIEGRFTLLDGNGNAFDLNGRTAVSICRCGQTKSSPFCDGTHNGCGFESKVVAAVLPPKK